MSAIVSESGIARELESIAASGMGSLTAMGLVARDPLPAQSMDSPQEELDYAVVDTVAAAVGTVVAVVREHLNDRMQ